MFITLSLNINLKRKINWGFSYLESGETGFLRCELRQSLVVTLRGPNQPLARFSIQLLRKMKKKKNQRKILIKLINAVQTFAS